MSEPLPTENVVDVVMSTLADFTTDEIRDGLESALRARDLPAAASLLCALATREPTEAELYAYVIRTLAEGARL